jgi:hypothetical protein
MVVYDLAQMHNPCALAPSMFTTFVLTLAVEAAWAAQEVGVYTGGSDGVATGGGGNRGTREGVKGRDGGLEGGE